MTIKTSASNFIPALSGRALDMAKIAAAFFMVIDHINALLLHEAYPVMYFIGRATFPLFCYALAAALLRQPDDTAPQYAFRTYATRLLLLAILTEPISMFTRDAGTLNVIFTLAFGAIFAGISYKIKNYWVYLCTIVAIGLMYFDPVSEFGTAGVVLPALILMAMRGDKSVWPFLIATLLSINALGIGTVLDDPETSIAGLAILLSMAGLSAILLPFFTLRLCKDVPQDGRYLHKYALHIFYPGHLIILWTIAHFILRVS